MTASSTTPPDSTAWTTEIGAIAIAATWRIHAPTATPMPIANHFDVKSAMAERNGWRTSTAGAAHAPRYL